MELYEEVQASIHDPNEIAKLIDALPTIGNDDQPNTDTKKD